MTLLAPAYSLFLVLFAGAPSTGTTTVVSQYVGDFASMSACERAGREAKTIGPAAPTPGFVCVQKSE